MNVKLISVIVLLLLFMPVHWIFAQELPFQVGEKLSFQVDYEFVNAGIATLEIPKIDTVFRHPCYNIRSIAKTNGLFSMFFKVRDQIDSYWDTELFVTRKYVKKLLEGSYKQFRIHYYFPEDTTTTYIKYKKSKRIEKKFKTLPSTQDVLSAFYKVRMMNFEVGDSMFINVTADGRNYRAKINVEKKEVLDTIFGKKECFLIVPVLKGEAIFKQKGKIEIWVTADKYKIPVMLKSKAIIGYFKAKLIDAEKVKIKNI
ncbi:MAG: hypothetical protein DRH57_03270 [Candidatus Cloacimonadota bacterium]|nr:MAG: hypothetical protein DRH57_03270 [Candidatus Cloacimonadota bacterium]